MSMVALEQLLVPHAAHEVPGAGPCQSEWVLVIYVTTWAKPMQGNTDCIRSRKRTSEQGFALRATMSRFKGEQVS
jgi:hypothetical protein